MDKTHPSLGDPNDVVDYYPLQPFSSEPSDSSHKIRVRVPQADIPLIFAHRQWRAGMLLADLIYSKRLPLEGTTVLELGAGTGLPSIVAHLFGNSDLVIATDYDSPSLVSTLRSNIKENTSGPSQSKIKVAGHTWSKAIDDVQDLVPKGSFDVILLADCIWDALSHIALLKSVTALLTKGIKSRVYMVSGLHTGRSKIVSFIRRAHRLGLRLIDFPSASTLTWPQLSSSETEVEKQEAESYASDEALAQASKYVVEMQLIADQSEEATNNEELNDGTRLWCAKSARLSSTRRTFVIEDREEERPDKTDDSFHIRNRNRWITFLALAWQES